MSDIQLIFNCDFLKLASVHVPAADLNNGLQDQRAAFTFVQDNIAQFGGDPSKASFIRESPGLKDLCHSGIFTRSQYGGRYATQSVERTSLHDGLQSAGAGSVEAQVIFHSSRSLFRAAIMDSAVGPL